MAFWDTVKDVFTGIRLALKYGPTIRAGIEAALSDPRIMAAIQAAIAAANEFQLASQLVPTPVAPAEMLPSITPKAAVEELSKPSPVIHPDISVRPDVSVGPGPGVSI